MAEADQNQWIEGRARVEGAAEHILPRSHDYGDRWNGQYHYISDYDCIFDYPVDLRQINEKYGETRWQNLQRAKQEGTKIKIRNLAHLTSEANADGIITSGGFKGGVKKINEGRKGDPIQAKLSWWSPKFKEKHKKLVRDTLNDAIKPFYGDKDKGLENQFATSKAFQPPASYGEVFFKYSIKKLCKRYIDYRGEENQIQFKILGTYVYACEIMYAVLVCSDKDLQFSKYPAVPGDGNNEAVVTHNNLNWVWRPRATSTTITRLDGFREIPKYRRWEHVAFAFYVPQGVFNLPKLQAHRHELCEEPYEQ